MRGDVHKGTNWDCYLLLQDPVKRKLIWEKMNREQFRDYLSYEWTELTGLQLAVFLRLPNVVKLFLDKDADGNHLNNLENSESNIDMY